MINIDHIISASSNQMRFIIEGMRNPMNSWNMSDSGTCAQEIECTSEGRTCLMYDAETSDCKMNSHNSFDGCFMVGERDFNLMKTLAIAGKDHRKFMRMIPVYLRITAPLYWWKEFDTYKVGTVANSCSTMHKIHAKEFTLEDFSCEHLDDVSKELLEDIINHLNDMRVWYNETHNKGHWWQMIQLLPSSYNQTRNVMVNYEVLANMYDARKKHKLDEWKDFCKWVETLPYAELITGPKTKEKEES